MNSTALKKPGGNLYGIESDAAELDDRQAGKQGWRPSCLHILSTGPETLFGHACSQMWGIVSRWRSAVEGWDSPKTWCHLPNKKVQWPRGYPEYYGRLDYWSQPCPSLYLCLLPGGSTVPATGGRVHLSTPWCGLGPHSRGMPPDGIACHLQSEALRSPACFPLSLPWEEHNLASPLVQEKGKRWATEHATAA